MNIDLFTSLSTIVKLIAENSVLVVSGGIIVLIAIIAIAVAITFIKNAIKQQNATNQQNYQFVQQILEQNKEAQKRDRDDRNKQIMETLKRMDILSEKIDVLLEGINNSFQGIYTIMDTLANKINDEKELSEEEFLRQAIAYMEIAILTVRDILLLKVERNNLVEQRYNNIGYSGTHKDGEIYETIMRLHTETRIRIGMLKFDNNDFKQKLAKKVETICDDVCEKTCFIFNVTDENYKKIDLNTQIRLLSNRTLTIVKSMTIDNIGGDKNV